VNFLVAEIVSLAFFRFEGPGPLSSSSEKAAAEISLKHCRLFLRWRRRDSILRVYNTVDPSKGKQLKSRSQSSCCARGRSGADCNSQKHDGDITLKSRSGWERVSFSWDTEGDMAGNVVERGGAFYANWI